MEWGSWIVTCGASGTGGSRFCVAMGNGSFSMHEVGATARPAASTTFRNHAHGDRIHSEGAAALHFRATNIPRARPWRAARRPSR